MQGKVNGLKMMIMVNGAVYSKIKLVVLENGYGTIHFFLAIVSVANFVLFRSFQS